MLAKKKIATLGALACVAVLGGGVAVAQQLDPGVSCLEGAVPSMTWAELESNYKESMWDSKAAVRLRSNDDALELKVSDIYGNSVCEQTADSRTRCKFNFPASYSGIFNIRVENALSTPATYRLCAE